MGSDMYRDICILGSLTHLFILVIYTFIYFLKPHSFMLKLHIPTISVLLNPNLAGGDPGCSTLKQSCVDYVCSKATANRFHECAVIGQNKHKINIQRKQHTYSEPDL